MIGAKERIILTAVTLATFCVVDLAFLLVPQFTQFQKVAHDFKQMSSEIKIFQEDILNKDAKLKQKEKLEDQLLLLEGKFSNNNDFSPYLAIINDAIKNSGVNAQTAKPLPVELLKNEGSFSFYILPLEVIITDKYHKFGTFLNKLETTGYFIGIKGLEITANYPQHLIRVIVWGVGKK